MTPTVTLFGIAGNFAIDSSKTFFGSGFVAVGPRAECANGTNTAFCVRADRKTSGCATMTRPHGFVGVGLARVLGLCEPLEDRRLPDAAEDRSRRRSPRRRRTSIWPNWPRAIWTRVIPRPSITAPRIDLLGATAEGAPNVVNFFVNQAPSNMGFKELDDNYVGMNLALAQQLLYGRGEHKAVSIEIQLHRTEDMPAARARLETLFAKNGLALEIHDFKELQPQYNQIVSFMSAIFTFISVIMGVIVLFTIVNTMSMSVMERTNEIGTARAMGVRRSGIRRQFLIEGWMLGAIGATAGIILATLIANWFNHTGVT